MYDSYIVKRTQIYLDEDQDRLLAKRAKASGSTKSSLIRAAITAFLATPDDESLRLERFREAVAKAAGTRRDLPPGAEYVEQLRSADRKRAAELDERHRR